MQATLFNVEPEQPTAPYAKGSETSKAAAEAIWPHLIPQALEVLRLFAVAGEDGLTEHETRSRSRGLLSGDSIRPRRKDLEKWGYIREAEGVKRPTPSKRLAQVWRITEAGRRRLEEDTDGE